MELIAGRELLRLIGLDPPLLSGLVDPEAQVQMNGVDLTLETVGRWEGGPGRIDFDNSGRRIPPAAPIPASAEGVFSLPPGPYWIRYNETVHIPADVFAFGRTRSSLLRSGAQIGSALWDSGYSGRSGSLLTVHHPAGIELVRDARVLQLVFFRLDRPADTTYQGIFQGE